MRPHGRLEWGTGKLSGTKIATFSLGLSRLCGFLYLLFFVHLVTSFFSTIQVSISLWTEKKNGLHGSSTFLLQYHLSLHSIPESLFWFSRRKKLRSQVWIMCHLSSNQLGTRQIMCLSPVWEWGVGELTHKKESAGWLTKFVTASSSSHPVLFSAQLIVFTFHLAIFSFQNVLFSLFSTFIFKKPVYLHLTVKKFSVSH